MTDLGTDIPRFQRPVEVARDVKLHKFQPDTEQEHRELVKGLCYLNKVVVFMGAMLNARDKMPEKWADTLNGSMKGFFIADITEADVEAARELADEMEKALDVSEFRS